MSQVYANILNGIVINTIVVDDYNAAADMLGAENLVLVTEETGNPEINGAWDGTVFQPAPILEEPTE